MSSTMRAIRHARFGGPDVLQLQIVEVPLVPKDMVLVAVVCAGVSHGDATYIDGTSHYILPDLPFTTGMEGSGIVRAIGHEITKFKVGQRVFVCEWFIGRYGTYAEYTLAYETDVFPLPDCLSFEEGAAIGVSYFTAYRALVEKAECIRGETVLVHGASGSTGLAAVQIAKRYGLTVIGTAGTPEGMEVVRRCGADFVLCHRKKEYLEAISEITKNKGVDILLELVAHVNLDNDLDVMAYRGRLVVIGGKGRLEIDPRKIKRAEIRVLGVALGKADEREWKETSEAVLRMCREGCIRPVISRKFPLALASEALKELIDSRGARGKIILSVRDQSHL